MKKTIANIMAILCTTLVFAQDNIVNNTTLKNTVYIEGFGQGLFGSINYDRILNAHKSVKNSFSVGLVYVPEFAQFGDGFYYGIPLSYNWLFGQKSHHLELGAGLTSLLVNLNSNFNSNLYAYLSPRLGYRFQNDDGGIFLKVTAYALIDVLNVNSYGNVRSSNFSTLSNVAGLGRAIMPWPGFSLGYTF